MKKLIICLFILRGFTADAQCVSGDCTNGFGTANIRKIGNVRYVGFFKNRQPDGRGIAEYADGTRYEGDWQNGKWHGQGRLTMNDKTELVGMFKESRYLGDDPSLLDDRPSVLAQNTTIAPSKSRSALPILTEKPRKMAPQKNAADADFSEPSPQELTQNVAETKQNSTPQYATPTKRLPQVWVLAVGVAVYDNPKISLKYPQSDALHMVNLWRGPEGGSLDFDHISTLTNDMATRQNILDSMQNLFSRAQSEDLVVFYFSGHGLKGSFLPYDYNYDSGERRLEFQEVNDLLARCAAQHKLVIADACHAGSYNYLASKSVENPLFKRPDAEANEAFFRELNRASPGTAFLMSSLAEEESLEVSTLHQSVFTHFILRGLRGEANRNGDKVISVKELFDFVHQNVSIYANSLGKTQTPILKGNFDPTMPVAMLRR